MNSHRSLLRGVASLVAVGLGLLLLANSAGAQGPVDKSEANPALLDVLDQPLLSCSRAPLTGYTRNGSCVVSKEDAGVYGVCAVMSARFLAFTKGEGNDLITPNPKQRFPGLKPGDRWCVCAGRWQQALDAGVAPKVVLAATSKSVLDSLFMDDLTKHATKPRAPSPPVLHP